MKAVSPRRPLCFWCTIRNVLFSIFAFMIKCVSFVIMMLAPWLLIAQHTDDLPSRLPPGEWENVVVENIADDSLCTTFMIWIRGGVKHHFHETHTESIYVLEGEGIMELGEKTFNVNAGDYVMIPKNTVHAVTATASMKVLSIQTPQWKTEDRKFMPPMRRPHNE